ncbi:hypothetical protein ACRS8P_36805 [Burkholderia cenocepacia]
MTARLAHPVLVDERFIPYFETYSRERARAIGVKNEARRAACTNLRETCRLA